MCSRLKSSEIFAAIKSNGAISLQTVRFGQPAVYLNHSKLIKQPNSYDLEQKRWKEERRNEPHRDAVE